MKRIPSFKKEMSEIFKADVGAPENYDVFMAIWVGEGWWLAARQITKEDKINYKRLDVVTGNFLYFAARWRSVVF